LAQLFSPSFWVFVPLGRIAALAQTRLVSALGFLWLAMLLTLALLDYLTRSPMRMPWQ